MQKSSKPLYAPSTALMHLFILAMMSSVSFRKFKRTRHRRIILNLRYSLFDPFKTVDFFVIRLAADFNSNDCIILIECVCNY